MRASRGARRLSIRAKLLLLLVAFALGTLVIVGGIELRSGSALGERLGAQTRRLLAEHAEAELAQFVTLSSQILERDTRVAELMLEAQRRDVRRALLGPAPDGSEPIYTDADYRAGRVPGVGADPRFVRIGPEGPETIAVSSLHPVFKLAPGVDEAVVAGELARLEAGTRDFRELRSAFGRDIYWQYTGTASGVLCSYPGRGGYPEAYDPRARPWYTLAAEGGEAVWSMPIIDATTNQLSITRAAPITDDAGNLLAVTAVDVILTDILARIELPDRLARRSVSMLVTPAGPDDADPVVLAERASTDRPVSTSEPGEWDVLPEVYPLRERVGGAGDGLLERLASGESGVIRLPWDGEDSFWAFAPVHARRGTSLVVVVPVADLVAAADEAEQTARAETYRRQVFIIAALLGVGVVVVLVALRASRTVTRPVRRLQEAAERISEGDLDAKVRVTTNDELGRLGRVFNAMIPKLRDRVRMRESLSLAMEVQQRLLPEGPPALDGWDLWGHSVYCDETGGDYYDFIDVGALEGEPGRVAIVVGDVTGHGIAAALLMATARAMLRSRIAGAGSIASLMDDVNRELTRDSDAGRFMTTCFMIVEAGTRKLRWVSAGHDPALLYLPESDTFEELGGEDIPLGIEGSWSFREHDRTGPPPGAVLVIGTDGIWEARNPEDEMFGKERMREAIREAAGGSAEAIATHVAERLAAFCGTAPQKDDVTLLVAKAV